MGTIKEKISCYHCGDICDNEDVTADGNFFCCPGCKTVYQIFSENDLTCYYDLQKNPGSTPNEIKSKYDFLDNTTISEKLLEFDDGKNQIITLDIPIIHCSSCIWILENLNKLNDGITASQVNFPKKTVRVTFSVEKISLKKLVLLLSSIGYEPYISLENYTSGKKEIDRSLIYKLAVAGFAFGNIMFLSFPEYFNINNADFWLLKYKPVFRWLMFAFSVPVVFYSGKDYFISAYKGLKAKILNIDVPIVLGISVLFFRSTYDIFFNLGSGFFDSLTGLIFFLLLGKFFQQRTYSFLSFERDYKSYFPIAVTRINIKKEEETVPVYEIKKGDRLLIRNKELIPVDGILISEKTQLDYSFVTGEADAVQKLSGDKLYAGGKQLSGLIEMEVLNKMEQSYLTQLWSNEAFKNNKEAQFKTLIDSISKRFTIVVLSIAFLSTAFWLFTDASKALNVFTAVLIIACPCAIALSTPFTLGNILRIFGKHKFYLKNANIVERLSKITTVIFDKTGTITTNKKSKLNYHGKKLSDDQEQLLYNVIRTSNHPLNRQLYAVFSKKKLIKLDSIVEKTGKGITAIYNNQTIKIGSTKYVGTTTNEDFLQTSIHVSFDADYKGYFTFENQYREDLNRVFKELNKNFKITILSGDNEGEKERLSKILPVNSTMLFNQNPQQKLDFVKKMQQDGEKILMVGDGLNDAGALIQSDVGIVVSENINVFSPACDGILDASRFNDFSKFMNLSRKAAKIIKWSFLLSFIYNITGLYFAVTGQLEPIIAAILMPLSSISVVVFTTISTNLAGDNLE